MTLAQLQYFKTLAHVLHYTRAAEALHIAQPSLSYSINELEKELGVKLFTKEDRKILLTMYGEQFLPYVETALATLSDGTQALQQMAGSSYQIVRLGYFLSIASSLIPSMMDGLYRSEENQRLRFQFSEAGSPDLLNELKKGNLDLAFCMHQDDTIASVPVLEQPLYLVVPIDHPFAKREAVSLEDFAQEPIAMLDKTSSLRSRVDALYAESGLTPNTIFVVRECHAAMQYVALRLCVSILPQLPAMDAEKVKAIPIVWNGGTLSRTVFFSWEKNRTLPPAVRRVRNYIVDHFALPAAQMRASSAAADKARA